jgi:alanine-glyoxylate transaminase / (R)-3-amino-2-methylpropionate-pyruvate transaminase
VIPRSGEKMTTEQLLQVRKERMLPSVTHYYKKPLRVAKASMQWVWDDEGRKYLDAFGAIVTISAGHNHPRIKQRLKAWLDEDRPQHTTVFYLSEPVVELAAKLTGITPAGLKRAFFTNSGSEANELAILLARQFTGRYEIVALKHAYHGGTTGTMSLVAQHTWKWGGPGLGGISHAAQPNCYRCPWGASPDTCALECARDVEETIQTTTSGQIAAMIVEPIQGVGGFIVPPKEYFPRVQEIVRKYGGLYISDEVQTGVGRTGNSWFGVLHNGIVPDMMTMAKGLGNGASIGGIVTRDEIADSMKGKIHFNTYAGNPWATLQAAETLSIIEDEGLMTRAARLGELLMDGLKQLQKDSKTIGDVRGRGLLVGVELVKDRKSKAYGTEEALEVMEQARDRGLLIGKGGLHGNVIRITPPMCVEEGDVREIVRIFGEAVQAAERKLGY